MTSRSRYWSCSRFADWLRGTVKISSGTGSEWRLWKAAAKETHPIRYWLAEEGLDRVQDFVNWPADRFHDIRYYINNRWITRTHALTAHARDIPRGEWRDVGDRFLPCLFNELVDFVEVETAWHHVLWDESVREQYGVPWARRFLRFRTWRSAAAGIAHLEWAATLTNVEWLSDDEKHLAEPTRQALAAQEILALYRWWTEIRPARPDPYEVSGWNDYCDRQRDTDRGFWLDLEDQTARDRRIADRALTKLRELEQAHEQEDEAMMIRLIRVRNSLWT
jgi:hypothetical protein